MENLTIVLSTNQLRSLVLEQMILAESFGWTGWRIPIYLDNISKGDVGENSHTFSAGSWLSNNSWQPDALEVYGVVTWNIDEDGFDEDGFDKDEEISHQADYLLGEYWEELVRKVEENITDFFYNYEQKEVEIVENIKVVYNEETERLLFEQEQKRYADNIAISYLFHGLKSPVTKTLIESLQQIEQYQKDVEQRVLNLHKENQRLKLENIDLLNKLVNLMTDKKL